MIKSFVAVVFFCCCLLSANAQDVQQAGKWMVGVRLSPVYNFRFLSRVNQETPYGEPVKANWGMRETGRAGSGIGFFTKYALGNLSMITGLEYNHSSINSYIRQIHYEYTDPISSDIVSGDFVESSLLGKIQNRSKEGKPRFEPCDDEKIIQNKQAIYRERIKPARYYFRAIEIPLALRREFHRECIGWFMEGGLRLRYMHNYSIDIDDRQKYTWSRESLSGVYRTAQAGAYVHAGIQFPIWQFNLEAGPSFNAMLSPLQKQGGARLYQAGGSCSIWYRF